MTEPYVELHARSAFSFLQGASTPEDLVAACAELGIPAMALLDRDGVYGAPRFHMAAKKTGMRAHIGVGDHLHQRPPLSAAVREPRGLSEFVPPDYAHEMRAKKGEGAATLEEIARVRAEGWSASRRISTKPWPAFSASTIFMPNCSGIWTGTRKRATRRSWKRRAAWAFRWWPPMAFVTPVREQREVLDVLTCVREKVTLKTAGRLLAPNAERYLKSARRWRGCLPMFRKPSRTPAEISARLEFTLADLGYEFPRYPVPDGRNHGFVSAQAHG